MSEIRREASAMELMDDGRCGLQSFQVGIAIGAHRPNSRSFHVDVNLYLLPVRQRDGNCQPLLKY